MVEGKSLADVKAIGPNDLLDEISIPVSPARMKCAMLGLKVLKAGVYGIDHANAALDDD
jgi:nitrogen fixation NifU-like protein